MQNLFQICVYNQLFSHNRLYLWLMLVHQYGEKKNHAFTCSLGSLLTEIIKCVATSISGSVWPSITIVFVLTKLQAFQEKRLDNWLISIKRKVKAYGFSCSVLLSLLICTEQLITQLITLNDHLLSFPGCLVLLTK